VIAVLVFLVSLPLAVYTWAGCFLLIDLDDRIRAVRMLCARLLIVMALVFITPAPDRIWIGVAFLVVAILHVATYVLVRMSVQGRWPVDRID
jgi:hypothetical protein